MSYLALYRKWRPQNFDEVKGQEVVSTVLKNQIINNKIAHAYLFSGTRGTGKTSIAKIMARSINCLNQVDGNPCNKCDNCKNILNDASISIVELDAATNNGIEDIRLIKEQVAYPPTDVKYKVFIIDEAHMLSKSAANALLKTLEEPPEYAVFILATTEANKLPITVCSRCQRYDFKRIKTSIIVERIKEICKEEEINISDKAANYIAISSDGALRDAISILDECTAFYPDKKIEYEDVINVIGTIDVDDFTELLKYIISGNINALIEIVNKFIYDGRELSQLVNDFLWYLRNILIIKSGQDSTYLLDLTNDAINSIKSIKDLVKTEQLIRYITAFGELSNKIKFANQKRVLFELELIKLMTPQMDNNIEGMYDRLTQLEERINNGNVIKVTNDTIKEEKEKILTLDKAVYNDYTQIKNDWEEIKAKLNIPKRLLLDKTKLHVEKDGQLIIVFNTEKDYKFFDETSGVLELQEVMSDKYNKNFNLKIELDKRNKYKNIKYSIEDILANEIDMEIEEIIE